MAERHRSAPRPPVWGAVGVLVVLIIAGFTLTTRWH